eukprot:scaffold111891_cov64-Phaeocystis_antarctica.AAC.6
MYWSQTESSKCSLDSLSFHPRHPFNEDLNSPKQKADAHVRDISDISGEWRRVPSTCTSGEPHGAASAGHTSVKWPPATTCATPHPNRAHEPAGRGSSAPAAASTRRPSCPTPPSRAAISAGAAPPSPAAPSSAPSDAKGIVPEPSL